MVTGGGAEYHQNPHQLQPQQQHHHHSGLDVVVHNTILGPMGGSPEEAREGPVGPGEGGAGTTAGGPPGGIPGALVVHQAPIVVEMKGLKKAKREIVGGEEKKKENPTDWSENAVNYLLEMYEEKYVSLSRGNLRSNDWEEVARFVNLKCEGSRSTKTAEQCKWKMENLKRRYKVEKQRQAATGAVNSLWPFFPRMDDMLASSFKFVATSPENGSGDPEEHPSNISMVAASPQRSARSSHPKTEPSLKKENDTYGGGCAMGSVTIKDLQKRMADFARERDWDQFHSPRNLLLALVGEVGELSEIFQWKGEVPRGLPGWNVSEKEHLGEELSDVLLYLVRLADVCEVDLGQAALRKLKKNGKKYPVELCKGTARKYTPYDNAHGEDIVLDKV